MAKPTTTPCPLCQRDCPRDMMQRHHLQTRKVDRFNTELICSDCHKHIHAFFENRKVARELNTIEALLADDEFQKALKFIRKQAPGSRTTVRTTRRKRR
jgi:flagellar biosynthesis regulator FlbT